jgi:protein-disulfide isomerase
MLRRLTRLIALPAIALLTLAPTGTATRAPAGAPTVRGDWNNRVTITPGGGHMLGNPAATVKLTEYASYTCSHCAEFEIQANGALRISYIASGQLAYEVRHYVRDPIDMTVALLANCGAPNRFFLNHAAFMRSQRTWMQLLTDAGPATRARWNTGTMVVRRRAIATDLHLYDIAATRGYDRNTAERCLADEAMATRLAAQTEEGNRLQITGTPSFLINQSLLLATYDWATLRPQLAARF